MITDEPISSVLARAKEFKKPPSVDSSKGYKYIGRSYTNLGEILTPEELAQRLKVSVEWITEKRRPRCPNPIPAIPIGKQIRFDWESVVKWLEQCAADAESLKQRRENHVPQRRSKKNVIAFPARNEEKDEATTPARKHRKA